MKLLAWMLTAYFLFLLLFLRFLPSKAGPVGQTTTAPNNGAVAFGGPTGDMTYAAVTVSTKENPGVTGLHGSHEPCGQIPKQEPPELIVILKKETRAREGLQDEVNFKFWKDGEATEVGDEDGMSIMCAADYPISLEIQLNDGYFTYFFQPDRKYCKCEHVACSLCFKLGIRFPMKVWNSLKDTRLTFTCRPISGRAMMQKKAMLTRSGNSTHNVEILTTSTEKLETPIKPPTSSGRVLVQIGSCQLESNGNPGFLREASEIFPACNFKRNMDKGTKPCLKEVNPVKLTGTKGNSFVDTNPSPFLDMDVLERMICDFGSTSMSDENAEKSEYSGGYGGSKSQTIPEQTLNCWFVCLLIMLIFTLIIMVPMCWVNFIRPWYRMRAFRRGMGKIEAQLRLRRSSARVTRAVTSLSACIDAINQINAKLVNPRKDMCMCEEHMHKDCAPAR